MAGHDEFYNRDSVNIGIGINKLRASGSFFEKLFPRGLRAQSARYLDWVSGYMSMPGPSQKDQRHHDHDTAIVFRSASLLSCIYTQKYQFGVLIRWRNLNRFYVRIQASYQQIRRMLHFLSDIRRLSTDLGLKLQ